MNLIMKLYDILKFIGRTVLDVFFPKRCVLCNSFVNFGKSISLCTDCKNRLADHGMVFVNNDKYYEEAICALEYENCTKDAMTDFKFRNLCYLSKTFAYVLYNKVKNRNFLKDISFVCPVPLHPSRMRDYNQSALIAKDFSDYSSIPLIDDVLIKIKDITPLSKMTYPQRNYMIKSAFALNPIYDISGKTVCLIDDIYTTSATANECARVLRQNGAKRVYVLCACYTPDKKKGEN
ncbi:MAG: ComF family protein [Clostridia bacterium]|nr:ComF family protein [Clostridia bacterium]